MPSLLVIDDKASILQAFRRAFRDPDVTLYTASTAAEGLELVSRHRPDVVILDIYLPDLSGLEAFRRIRQLNARIPVILITGHGTTETAIEAMKLGAFDYLLKPLDVEQLQGLVARAFTISRLMQVPAVIADEEPVPEGADVLVGRSPAMQEVYKAVGRVAPQDLTVLIQGESGTGKELVARAIYRHSARAAGPFLAINCAAIPETLLESELFGHERGAFTGADRKRIGKFEQCSGGTLFLDEIGDMSPLTQTKILRVLQEQRFERVGGNETVQADVRVITATNKDLKALTAAGQFRDDLYYRLSVYTICLPPLRERGEDLPLLVEHFIRRFSRELGKEIRQVDPETLQALRRYPWPGNLRELQSVLKQALLHATGSVLLPDFLPSSVRTPSQETRNEERGTEADVAALPPSSPSPPPLALADLERVATERLQAGSQDLYAEVLTLVERQLLTQVLRHTGGNQVQAARILGITRNSLRFKLRNLGIMVERSVWAADDQPD